MKILSAKNNTSVMLEVKEVNREAGKVTNVATYMGFMSNKHLYVRLIKKNDSCKDFPKYLRVKRSYTEITEKYRIFSGLSGATYIRILEYPEGTKFCEDGRIFRIFGGTPEAQLIDEVIPSELLNTAN